MNKVACLLFVAIITAGTAWSAPGGKRGSLSPVVMNPDTGSDAWGYTWFRSDEPGGPTFHWVDITTRGTLVSGLQDDNFVGPFQMQFSFPYYWYSANTFYVGSNGYISLTHPSTSFDAPFAALPSTSAAVPRDLFAVCVGDLDFTVAASNPQCYYWTNGSDSLVVSFINVTEWQQVANPNLKHTFQVILHKTDSSITYQYGAQQGTYNSPSNNTLCIGWQNNSGQIGRSYTYSTTPPHALMPDSGFAIRIKRIPDISDPIRDLGIVGGFDAGNLAKVMRTGFADTVRCVVKNYGTIAESSAKVRYAITGMGQPAAYDTVIVPSVQYGQQVTVTFPRLFTPAVTGTYSALFNVTIPIDVGPANNNKTAEILSASFGIDQSTLIRYETGTVYGSVIWPDSGGFGVAIDLPPAAYPVRVETVYVRTGTVMSQPMTVEVLDGSSGAPGTVLATRTVTATANAMNAIVFTTDNVVIGGGRFFVAARGNMEFSYEALAPISSRTWEYTDAWFPYRDGDSRDIIIRASVRGVTTGVKQVSDVIPDGFVLEQNYHNPFNPTTTIRYGLQHTSPVLLTVFNTLGQQVAQLVNEQQQAGFHEVIFHGNGLASGVYFYRIQAVDCAASERLVLLK